jgi:hypothetical protein
VGPKLPPVAVAVVVTILLCLFVKVDLEVVQVMLILPSLVVQVVVIHTQELQEQHHQMVGDMMEVLPQVLPRLVLAVEVALVVLENLVQHLQPVTVVLVFNSLQHLEIQRQQNH